MEEEEEILVFGWLLMLVENLVADWKEVEILVLDL